MADPSRGTTKPGIELPAEVSASNTRRSIGSTASSTCAMRLSKTFGSLSASSTGTQAKATSSRSAHCDSKVVFPKPDGATTETIGGRSACASLSISNGRQTVPGRVGGQADFEVEEPETGGPTARDWPADWRMPVSLMDRTCVAGLLSHDLPNPQP